MSQTYLYSVAKFVPHPVRDESINLGVILISADGQYVDYRFNRRVRGKLRAMAPDIPPSLVERFVDDFQRQLVRSNGQASLMETLLDPTEETLRQLSGHRAYQVRFTAPRPVRAPDPDKALVDLFEEFVAPIQRAREGGMGRGDIRIRILANLRNWRVDDHVVERPEMPVKHGPNYLDIGITNGHGLVLAMEPIAFTGRAEEVVRQRDHLAWVSHDLERGNGHPSIAAILGSATAAHENLRAESIDFFQSVDVAPIPVDALEGLREKLRMAGISTADG